MQMRSRVGVVSRQALARSHTARTPSGSDASVCARVGVGQSKMIRTRTDGSVAVGFIFRGLGREVKELELEYRGARGVLRPGGTWRDSMARWVAGRVSG